MFYNYIYYPLLSGWWYTYPSEKYEFVSWDDEIPNWMERHKIPWFQTTNQLYSPIINHYQPLSTISTIINQDYPIYYGKSTIWSIVNHIFSQLSIIVHVYYLHGSKPPTSCIRPLLTIINHYQPYQPLLTRIIPYIMENQPYDPLLTIYSPSYPLLSMCTIYPLLL